VEKLNSELHFEKNWSGPGSVEAKTANETSDNFGDEIDHSDEAGEHNVYKIRDDTDSIDRETEVHE
jgi:hypothetical protein